MINIIIQAIIITYLIAITYKYFKLKKRSIELILTIANLLESLQEIIEDEE